MLQRIDRLQLVVADLDAAAIPFERLLGAARAREDRLRCLGARRRGLRLGAGEIELLAPDGAGAVADALARRGGGLFAAGASTHDLAALRRRLEQAGAGLAAEAGQLFVDLAPAGVPGLRLVVSEEARREPVGRLRALYEATLLVPEAAAGTRRFAELFGLDPATFVPIRSEEYGYAGTLALFERERLDRIEIVTPFDLGKTMGRFFARHGAALYMAYAECDDTAGLRGVLEQAAPRDWTGPRDGAAPDNLFLHPRALSGLLLGVSRTSFAWTWSGRPERVQRAR
jgi:hypothetical protein